VDALRSIIISEQLLGTTSILLIKHTGCGMLTFENKDIYPIINRNLGQGATGELEAQSFDFLPFADLVPRSVDVSGWIYEIETGKVRKVD
jgi:carbonic anhydrase